MPATVAGLGRGPVLGTPDRGAGGSGLLREAVSPLLLFDQVRSRATCPVRWDANAPRGPEGLRELAALQQVGANKRWVASVTC